MSATWDSSCRTFPVQCRPRGELSTVKYIGDFLKFQTVWCKSIGFELPRGGGRTDARTDARRNNQLRVQPSGEMHENKSAASALSPDYARSQSLAALVAGKNPKSFASVLKL